MVSCDVGLYLALLWLWCRPVDAAPIQPLAWEPPHTAGAALKKKKKIKFFGLSMQRLDVDSQTRD